MRRHLYILGAIIFLATVLRFYQLGMTPISLEWDEVAIGYDAYSILHTGRDQFGTFLPNTFRSLDDWKPPLFEYAAVPSVALFGLNAFAVRLPSAIAGILTVAITYWLGMLLFTTLSITRESASRMSLLAAFLLAVSPWSLQFSRATFEVNISVFITTLAIASFLQGLKNPKYFLISAVCFGLDLYSYHSTRVVAPLMLLTLFTLHNRYLPSKKTVSWFLIIFGLFFLSVVPILLSPDAQIRFKATNIFNPGARYMDEKDLPKEFLDERLKDAAAGYELDGKIFHNNRFIYMDYDTIKKAFFHYISHFDFEFLFIHADAPLHHAPGFGLLYLWELPFLLVGVWALLFKRLNRYTLFLLAWLLIAPIPVAVTREAPHAVRSELFLPSFQLIIALGIGTLIELLQDQKAWVLRAGILFVIPLFMANNAYYYHQYYVHTNYEIADKWLYGRKEAAEATESLKSNYDKVLVSMKVDMPYIFWLFYTKYPPEKYLSEGGTVSGGFADERNHFDKYEFKNFNYDELPETGRLLLVAPAQDFPPDAIILKTIYYPNGKEALKIAQR